MINRGAAEWFRKEEEKRENNRKKSNIFLVNQALANQIKRVTSFITKEDYETEARKYSRELVQCSIWDITYRNNFENEKVAKAQALLLYTILLKETEFPERNRYLKEVEVQMRRLGNVEWSIYTAFCREVDLLRRTIK